jgi:NodT family efflux transporter outer membrane factor (OMF) lipoprotein
VGPDYVRPKVPLNANWTQNGDQRLATQTAVDSTWWRSFNDPQLNGLVELAYHQNLPLQIAGIRILEARAQLGIAWSQYIPQNVNPVFSGGGAGIMNHTNGNDLDFVSGGFQVGFDAAWEVDIWGKLRRGVKAAKAGYFATVADYDNALVALTAEVARTYVLIRTDQVLIELARQNVAVQEDGQHVADARFRNGATSELDVNQATTLLETTRSTIPQLEASLQQANNALCTLLGQPSGCVQLAAPNLIPSPPPQVGIGVPAELLRRRADVRAAELNAIAQCDRIGVAKAELYPKLVLFGSVGTQTVSTSGAPSTVGTLLGLFPLGSLIWQAGASLFWPLLNYPRILNNVRVEDARYQEALIHYQDTVLHAAQEVEDGIAGYLRQEEAVVFAENAVVAAASAVKLALVQYREGAVDYTRVLDSQRSLLDSQNKLAQARSLVATSLVALYKALGGGWELRPAVIPDATRSEMKKRTNWGSYFEKPVKR